MRRHTPQLRVVVIGGGCGGLRTAYYAARGGASVHVIEERLHCGGLVRSLSRDLQQSDTSNRVLDLALRVESGREFAEFERETSFAVTRTGYMRLARTAAQWERVVSTIQSGDYPDTTLIDAAQGAELVPGGCGSMTCWGRCTVRGRSSTGRNCARRSSSWASATA